MTRVVVIGPYPPTADPRGDTVLAAVRRLRAEGATVTVVSPEPSAAPVWGDPADRVGATRVARAVRGADRVVWFVSHGVTPAGPLRRALAAIPTVEVRPASAPAAPERRSPGAALRRARAGAPTYARTVVGRWRGVATRARR